MGRFTTVLVGLLAVLAASTSLHAQNASVESTHVNGAAQQQEMLQQDVALQLASIKSRQDLEQYLRNSGSASPLAALSESGKRRFIASLKWTGQSSVDTQSPLCA